METKKEELTMAAKRSKDNTSISFRADPDVFEWLNRQPSKTDALNKACRAYMAGAGESDDEMAFQNAAQALREEIQQLADLSKVVLMDHAHEESATNLYAKKYHLTQDQAAHEAKIHKYHLFDDQGIANHPGQLVVCTVIMDQLEDDISGAYIFTDMLAELRKVRKDYVSLPWASLLSEKRRAAIDAMQDDDKFTYSPLDGSGGRRWSSRVFEEFGIRPGSE